MGNFKKLEVWQMAHRVTCQVYQATTSFPKTETYGLTAQLRRSASSIPANIAEGCGRSGDLEFGRFVRISLGSATELEYHLLLARDIGLLKAATYEELSGEVLRVQCMLARLNQVLKGAPRPPTANSQQRIASSE